MTLSSRTYLAVLAGLLLTSCSPATDVQEDAGADAAQTTASETTQTETEAATDTVTDAGVINLYSSRHYDTDLALYSDFTDETGIEVNRIEANANALIERMVSEGEFSPADLLITVDAGNLWRADEAGILASLDSETLEARIPDYLRHPDGNWFGLSKRGRVIIFNKEAGVSDGLDRYEDLADPAYEGMICMRSSGNIYNISLLSSLIAHDGAEAAEDWAEGVVSNFARRPQSNDSGQIEAVASGECGISVVNTYYLARYARSDDPQMREIFDSLEVVFPNQDDRGTHVNISGAALAKNAPNRENAIRFLEYLTSPSAQAYFANGNNEYPVTDDAPESSAVATLGTFKEDNLNVSTFGPNQKTAIEIFDRVGWQ